MTNSRIVRLYLAVRRAAMIGLATVCLLASVAPAQTRPFDAIFAGYTPFMDADDPLAFPLKVNSLASGPYKFWRGSKDLFFTWCQTNAADWLAEKDGWITSHGDIHLGNIGSYASDAGFGSLGFGLVDFDEACRTPFQLEIMQGLITVRLTARHKRMPLRESRQIELCQVLIDAYKQGLTSDQSAMKLLASEPRVRALFKDQDKNDVKDELKKIAADGRFIAAAFWKEEGRRGEVKDIYRPAMQRADDFAAGIEQAIKNSEPLRTKFRHADRSAIRAAIKDAAQRTRVDSSGSQGMKKYVILLEKPLKGVDHDLVLYLKQEIPSSAERAGLSPRDPRSPGERVARDSAAMLDPKPYLNSWCDIGAESYWVSFKEPWSGELSPEDFPSYDDLKTAATIWGVVAGASHRSDPAAVEIAKKITPALVDLMRQRSEAYLKQLDRDFIDFTSDARTGDHRRAAMKAVERYHGIDDAPH